MYVYVCVYIYVCFCFSDAKLSPTLCNPMDYSTLGYPVLHSLLEFAFPFCVCMCIYKEMATHSSILAWRIPWTEEPGRLQSRGSQELDTIDKLNHCVCVCVCVCVCILFLATAPTAVFICSCDCWLLFVSVNCQLCMAKSLYPKYLT